MSNSTYNQLTANLDLLKLEQMKLHLDEIRDFVTSNGLSFTEGLLKLSNYEVDFKEHNAARSMVKAAAFPFAKELKDYDFEFQKDSTFTDDTVLTVAVCKAILNNPDTITRWNIRKRGLEYAGQFRQYYLLYPNAGFGNMLEVFGFGICRIIFPIAMIMFYIGFVLSGRLKQK